MQKPVPVHPITLYCIMGFKNYLAQMIIMTRCVPHARTMSQHVGQISRSQSALKLCAYAAVKQVHVKPITLSCMVGFQNDLEQIIIMRQKPCH